MKKTLVALAALAATGAFAQSSVTIFGAVDASYNYASGDVRNADGSSSNQSKNSLGNSQLGSSKLGFTGSEDLGGGLRANFKLEAGLANDTGNGKASNSNNQPTGGCLVSGVTPVSQSPLLPTNTVACSTNGTQGLVFQRRSYVGLSGTWGEVKLGREYVNTFLGVQAAVDPFGTNGPADSTQMMLLAGSVLGKAGGAEVNASNMITYITPDMSGFSANLQYFMGENTSGSSNSDDGTGYSLTGQYAKGPLFVSLGEMGIKYNQLNSLNTATNLGDFKLDSFSISYNFGMAKLAYTWAHEGVTAMANTGPDWKNDSNLIGLTVPYGAWNFKGSYIWATNNFNATKSDTKGELFGLGVDYALSKRSVLYATYGNIKNHDGGNAYGSGVISGTLAADASVSNFAMGVYHSF